MEGSLREPMSLRPRRRPGVLIPRTSWSVDEVEAGVSENMHFYKAGPDRSRALLAAVI